MPFCKPPEGVKKSASTINPGTILMGIRIENSPYTFSVMVGGRLMAGRSRGFKLLTAPWSCRSAPRRGRCAGALTTLTTPIRHCGPWSPRWVCSMR